MAFMYKRVHCTHPRRYSPAWRITAVDMSGSPTRSGRSKGIIGVCASGDLLSFPQHSHWTNNGGTQNGRWKFFVQKNAEYLKYSAWVPIESSFCYTKLWNGIFIIRYQRHQ